MSTNFYFANKVQFCSETDGPRKLMEPAVAELSKGAAVGIMLPQRSHLSVAGG